MSNASEKAPSDWIWLLFSFKGRIGRKHFWYYWLGALVVGLGMEAIGASVEKVGNLDWHVITALVLFWPTVAVQAKRWHDINKSAWWVLINLVPVVGPLWMLVEAGFKRGDAQENPFGVPPRNQTEDEAFVSGESQRLSGRQAFVILFIGTLPFIALWLIVVLFT